LITFLQCHAAILREPLLCLSLYFKQNREEYYGQLDRVRTEGDWETWLGFFLEGVGQTAEGAVSTAQRLFSLFREDRERVQGTGRGAGSTLRVHDVLRERPLATLAEITKRTNLSFPRGHGRDKPPGPAGHCRRAHWQEAEPGFCVRSVSQDSQ
jgi:Fic family protein